MHLECFPVTTVPTSSIATANRPTGAIAPVFLRFAAIARRGPTTTSAQTRPRPRRGSAVSRKALPLQRPAPGKVGLQYISLTTSLDRPNVRVLRSLVGPAVSCEICHRI